jgi:hypothetical protein
MVTFRPLACKSFAREAAIIPLPKEEVTPPVTKIYLAILLTFVLKIKCHSKQQYAI